MSLRINTNIAAMDAYKNLSVSDSKMQDSLQKLSSGFRINKAADDAAGLAVSEGLKSQVGGLTVAARNAQDGVNVVQTADGALGEVTSILQRMRDLAVQASNTGSQDTNASAASQAEFSQLNSEIDRISSTTAFGQQKLLDGSYNGTFQVGANAGETIKVAVAAVNSTGLGTGALDLTSGASAAITAVDTAITSVSSTRANLGAIQNRFTHTINNLHTAIENVSASESSIADVDMAAEMTKYTKTQVLMQAGTAMLAQANQSSQSVLKLLQ